LLFFQPRQKIAIVQRSGCGESGGDNFHGFAQAVCGSIVIRSMGGLGLEEHFSK
jgi:hypothetical protein